MTVRGAVSPARNMPSRRFSTKRWLAAVAAVTCAAALCIAAAQSSAGSRALKAPAPAAAAAVAAAASSQHRCSPPVVATFTSHKTGTAQAGCLVALAIQAASQPVAHHYENAALSPHAVVSFAAAAGAQGEPPTGCTLCAATCTYLDFRQQLFTCLCSACCRVLPHFHLLHCRGLPSSAGGQALPLPRLPLRCQGHGPL